MESPLDPAEALWLLQQGLTPGFYESLSSPLEGQVARPEGATLKSPPLEGEVPRQGQSHTELPPPEPSPARGAGVTRRMRSGGV
jgi:hypothetical protein